MSLLKAVWLSVRAPLVAAKARQLQADGLVQKAPNIALLNVGEGEAQKFQSVLPDLMAAFDQVVVAWKTSAIPPESSERIRVVADASAELDRWDLVGQNHAGFVFPVSIDSVHSGRKIARLKSHLFSFGGCCAISFLDRHLPQMDDSVNRCSVTRAFSVDVNQTVFDQRFWRLKPGEIHAAHEPESFSTAAEARSFDLLICSCEDLLD